MRMTQIRITASFAALLLTCPIFAGVIQDDFSSAHNYLISGTAGTIWDGLQYTSPATVSTLDATVSNSGALSVSTMNGSWENTSANGLLLYLNVAGDFIAEMEIRTTLPVLYHDMGIMARVADTGSAGAGEDWVATRYFHANAGGGIISFRNTDNGTSTNYDAATLQRFMQLERSGDTFYYRSKVNSGDAWTLRRTQARTDFSGLVLLVGIWHATFSANTGNAQFEYFRIEGPNVNPPTSTPTITPTFTPTFTQTNTPSPTSTPSPLPTSTPTDIPTETPSPSPTPSMTATESPTETPTPTPTGTPTAIPPVPATGVHGIIGLMIIMGVLVLTK